MATDENATQTLHRLTSYAPDREWTDTIDDPRIVHDLEPNDRSRFPWWHKRYDQPLPRVALPRDLPATTASAIDVLAGSAVIPPADLDLPGLAQLLYLSAGIVRVADRADRRWVFRAAGSAGARFPLELYVAVPDGGALPAGVHWYDPSEHALEQVAPPPRGDAPALIVSGVPWRTGWRYRERGFRHVYWDAGTVLAQLLAAATSAGVAARLYSVFPDAAVTELVGADGVDEFPVAVVALGEHRPALEPSGRAARGAVDAAPLQFPLVTAAQHAGDAPELGTAWPAGRPVHVERAAGAGAGEEPLETIVLRRGSQRRMNASASVPRALLISSMQAAMRGIDVPHWVVVHSVDGMAAGVYRWPDLDHPVRTGLLRDELYFVCLDQGLGRDAAFVVVGAIDPTGLDDHGYRDAQLAAGIVEGRLHLIAYAQGISASGMTFLDSEIEALLGEPVQGLLFTCVGVPDYRSKQAGPPGAPAVVREVAPR